MIEQITDKDEQLKVIEYLNDAFDLHPQDEAFQKHDHIFTVYKNQMKDARSFLVHFLHYNKRPLVGIFFEWTGVGDEMEYGRNRMMWVSAEMAEIISRMNIGNSNVLFGKKKET